MIARQMLSLLSRSFVKVSYRAVEARLRDQRD